jgi:hypothetical protein
MKPIEAYNLLVNATGTIQANREVHSKIQEALFVIKRFIPVPSANEAAKSPVLPASQGVTVLPSANVNPSAANVPANVNTAPVNDAVQTPPNAPAEAKDPIDTLDKAQA